MYAHIKYTIVKTIPAISILFLINACNDSGTSIDTSNKASEYSSSSETSNNLSSFSDELTSSSSQILQNSLPIITLHGGHVLYINKDEPFTDPGMTAQDSEDGDITHKIQTTGEVNSNLKGDYLLKYSVTDSEGATSHQTRIIRVTHNGVTGQSYRLGTETNSSLDYLEHLPMDYGKTEETYPLIIFNHGSGSTNTGDLKDVECCSLPLLIKDRNWNDSLPFIVLSPQRILPDATKPIKDFIEYAMTTYKIDSSRIYMSGWSQGAQVTVRYITHYPNELAAIIPLAGGLFRGSTQDICNGKSTAMWTFLGAQDNQVINNAGTETTNAYNDCSPTIKAKLTLFTTRAFHWEASIWPFHNGEKKETDADLDAFDTNVFTWLLKYQVSH